MTTQPGSAGTAGRDYKIEPPTGRHRAPPTIPTPRKVVVVLAAGGSGVLVAALVAIAGTAAAPHIKASTAMPSERGDYPTARGADIAPGPLAMPTIVPADAPVWEEGKGAVIVDGRPLRTPSPVPVSIPVQAAAPEAETMPEPPPEELPVEAAEPPAQPPDDPVVDPPADPLEQIIDDTTTPDPEPAPEAVP